MGRYTKNNKSEQTFEVNRDLKIQSNKIGKCKNKIEKSEIGKPRDLGIVKLKLPDIWSSDKISVNILKFFIEEGRHFLLHLAGTKRSLGMEKNSFKKQKKEQKQIEIKQKQPLFEFLEQFSVEFLGLPRRNKKKERIVVFFLRSNRVHNLKPRYTTNITLKNQKWNLTLKNIKFLFDEIFYNELRYILFLLEDNIDIDAIAEQLISEFNTTINLENIQMIFKNLLIQIIKDHKDNELNYIGLYQRQSNEILEIYKQRISYYRDRIIKFIQNLKTLFDGQSLEQVQNIQYSQDDYQNLFNQNNCYQEENSVQQYFGSSFIY